MRETTVERHLVNRVRELGGMCVKFTSPGRRHVPDRIVFLPQAAPVALFFELKAPGKKLRAGQSREHARLHKLGFVVITTDSKAGVDLILNAWTKLCS